MTFILIWIWILLGNILKDYVAFVLWSPVTPVQSLTDTYYCISVSMQINETTPSFSTVRLTKITESSSRIHLLGVYHSGIALWHDHELMGTISEANIIFSATKRIWQRQPWLCQHKPSYQLWISDLSKPRTECQLEHWLYGHYMAIVMLCRRKPEPQ